MNIVEQYEALVAQRDDLNRQIDSIQRAIGGKPRRGRPPKGASASPGTAKDVILRTLADGKVVQTSTLKALVGFSGNATAQALWRLLKEKKIERIANGAYRIAGSQETMIDLGVSS